MAGKKPGEAYDPSRKGKGGSYKGPIKGGGTNPFAKTAKAKPKRKTKKA